jgi:hypothetical protein
MPKKKPRAAARPSIPKNSCRALMLVDNAAIRTRALKECERTEKKVAAAKAQIEAFETGHLARFTQWEARTLGPLMSELREVHDLIAPKAQLMLEIDRIMFLDRCGEVAAYRRAMEARENPAAAQDEPPPFGGDDRGFHPDDPAGADFGEEDFDPFGDPQRSGAKGPQRMLFPPDFRVEDWDHMTAAQRADVRDFFEEASVFAEILSGVRTPPFEVMLGYLRVKKASGGGEPRRGPEAHPAPSRASASPASRIKTLYRELVRELHPDHNGKQTAATASLWHQLQEAYAANDLETLEAIAGRVHLAHPEKKHAVAVSVLLRTVEQLKSSLHGLQKQIRRAKKHPAWEFDATSKRTLDFAKRRRREIQAAIDEERRHLEDLTRCLDGIAARAARSRPRKKKHAARGKPEPSAETYNQADLPF